MGATPARIVRPSLSSDLDVFDDLEFHRPGCEAAAFGLSRLRGGPCAVRIARCRVHAGASPPTSTNCAPRRARRPWVSKRRPRVRIHSLRCRLARIRAQRPAITQISSNITRINPQRRLFRSRRSVYAPCLGFSRNSFHCVQRSRGAPLIPAISFRPELARANSSSSCASGIQDPRGHSGAPPSRL